MPFNAFVSYARRDSTDEALALKAGLEGYARPWNRARSTEVFLDDASLSASPSLAGTLSQSLTASDWLIVLLSEAAAQSPWVDQEVAWWLKEKGPDRLLLVQVNGTVEWVRGQGFSDHSTAIPPSLRQLTDEPRWVDLTWFSQESSLQQDDPRFAEVVLQLFCPIHALDRSQAVALRDVRVRRAKRLARAAVASLSTLLVVAIISAGVAIAQMRLAQEQTNLATIRLLNAESQRLVGHNVGLSRLLAAQASSMANDDETKRTLFQSLLAGPHLVGELVAEQPTALASNADGTVITIASAGSVTRWDVERGTANVIGSPCSRITRVNSSADASVVVGTCAGGMGFAAKDDQVFDLGQVSQVAVSPSGDTIVFSTDGNGMNTNLSVVGRDMSAEPLGSVPGLGVQVALRDDATITALSATPQFAVVASIAPFQQLQRSTYPLTALENPRILSRTGEAFYDSDDVWTLPSARTQALGPFVVDPSQNYRDFVATAISDKGDLVAYGLTGGGIEVTTPAPTAGEVVVRARLEAGERIGPIAIGGSHRVIAAHDGVVSVWDLTAPTPLVQRSKLSPGVWDSRLRPNRTGSFVALDAGITQRIVDRAGVERWTLHDATFIGWRNDDEFLTVSRSRVELWSTTAWQPVDSWPWPGRKDKGRSGGWDGGSQALLTDSKTLYRVKLETGTFTEVPLDGRSVGDVSSDGSRVILRTDDKSYRVWTGDLQRPLYGPTTQPLSFADNGDVLEAGADGTQLISLSGDRELAMGSNEFQEIPISNDGDVYMTADTRGFARFVSRRTGREWGRVPVVLFQDEAMGESASGAFSGDGTRALILSEGERLGTGPVLTVVDLDPARMQDAVCWTVRRSLSPSEWRQLTGREAPPDLACAPDSEPSQGNTGRATVSSPVPAGTQQSPTSQNSPSVSVLRQLPSGSWITVVDSIPKTELDAASAVTRAQGFGASQTDSIAVVDTDVIKGLTPGYWALAVVGADSKQAAEMVCRRLGRTLGGSCYPRQVG